MTQNRNTGDAIRIGNVNVNVADSALINQNDKLHILV